MNEYNFPRFSVFSLLIFFFFNNSSLYPYENSKRMKQINGSKCSFMRNLQGPLMLWSSWGFPVCFLVCFLGHGWDFPVLFGVCRSLNLTFLSCSKENFLKIPIPLTVFQLLECEQIPKTLPTKGQPGASTPSRL